MRGAPLDPWNAVFHRHHDCAVYGGGLAGCAAALRLAAIGQRVVLIDERGDLGWEWGRAFVLEPGETDAPGWPATVDRLRALGGWCETASSPVVDGCRGELVCWEQVQAAGIALAFMLWPVGMARDQSGHLGGVTFASKDGLRHITAARWIDASESGLLTRLAGGPAPEVVAREWHYRWQCPLAVDLDTETADDARLAPGAVAEELDLTLVSGAGTTSACILDCWDDLPAAWRERLGENLLSHAGLLALDRYRTSGDVKAPVDNCALAVPGLAAERSTPADRWALGTAAADRILDAPAAQAVAAGAPAGENELVTEVAVIGAGTGGAHAAIAAAEAGATTMAIEPLAVPGGVGVVAGIHHYWWGVPGGLQQAIDAETWEWMHRIGIESDPTRRPWQPDVKGWVLDRRLRDIGVDRRYGSLLWDVRVAGGRVRSARIATPEGPRHLVASRWIDASGDGDLCARAGARTICGRSGDGRSHAYTQSSRLIQTDADGIPRMHTVNFDSGWVDPEDPADWTRARAEGLGAYVTAMQTHPEQRYTSIAAGLGLRQSRQVVTRQVLSIDDVFARRDADDAIGFAGCNVDNHSVDAHLEDDDFFFGRFVLGHGAIRMPVVALPYGMVVPVDLHNVWIACRACGVDPHAHYPVRMMRDIQRLGEACGIAAALSAPDADAHTIDLAPIRERLHASGALSRVSPPGEPISSHRHSARVEELQPLDPNAEIATALAVLHAGRPHLGLWWAARDLEHHGPALRAALNAEGDDSTWLAATTLAFGGDPAGASRLLRAWHQAENAADITPRWFQALVFLRMAGTAEHLAELAASLPAAPVFHDCLVAILHTAEHIAARDPAARATAERILAWGRNTATVGRLRPPQFGIGGWLQRWREGEAVPERIDFVAARAKDIHAAEHVHEEADWQRRLLCARLAVTCGEDPHADLVDLLADERAFVRRAATAVLTDRASAMMEGA